jgi:transcription elongation GreA/GreB family factor
MNVGNILSADLTKNNPSEIEPSVTSSSRHANRSDSRRRRNISRRISGMQSPRDLREAVERRFMRMTQAHDRIRTKLLAASR